MSCFGTFSDAGFTVRSPGAYGPYGEPGIVNAGAPRTKVNPNDSQHNGQLSANYKFDPALLADFWFRANCYHIVQNALHASINLAQQVGIRGINLPHLSGSGGLTDL